MWVYFSILTRDNKWFENEVNDRIYKGTKALKSKGKKYFLSKCFERSMFISMQNHGVVTEAGEYVLFSQQIEEDVEKQGDQALDDYCFAQEMLEKVEEHKKTVTAFESKQK